MTGLVKGIVTAAKAIPVFQFSFRASDGSGPQRLFKVIAEFLNQTGVECVENAYDSNDNPCIMLRRSEWAKEEGIFPLFHIPSTEFIGIVSDYTTVFLRSDGTCIVDLTEQLANPGRGEGGYFAAQPGTAIGRTLGQGFTPTDHDNRNMWLYWPEEREQALPDLDLSDIPGGEVEWIDSDEILICQDGHLEIVSEEDGKKVYQIISWFVQ